MRTSLIYCGIGVAGFNSSRPLGDREGSWIGHGIASIGASVKTSGFDVGLIDLRQLSGWEQFSDIIREEPADVYCLSVSAVDHFYALKAVYEVKINSPKSKIIVGGIHPSIFPEKYQYAVINSVVQGEGEITVVDLLKKVQSGQPLPKNVRGEKPDLTGLPWVDRELFDYKRELSCFFAPDQATPSITMLAGRGCQYLCSYCQPAENAVFGKPYRIRSPKDVVDELVSLKDRYQYKSITFWDDTFTFNPKWVSRFCSEYESAGIGATIAACSRADIICKNEAMVERLASVGLDWFVIGFESGSQRILDLISKGTTVEQNLKAARLCRKYGIKVFGTYMYGLPTETKEEAMATAKMIDEIQPEHPSPFYFIPIESTRIYSFCEENDLLLGSNGSIARTGVFSPTLKGIDYGYLDSIRSGYRH